MSQHVYDFFIAPLKDCFTPRSGQDFGAFGQQLMEDLAKYPSSVLAEAAKAIRRTRKVSTWPTIAECIEAASEARVASYVAPKPREQPTKPYIDPAKLRTLRIDPGGGFPGLDGLRAWNLPAGTLIVAADATLLYPNGASESWGDARRRRARERVEAA